MFNSQRHKALLCLKGIIRTSPTPQRLPLWQHYPSLTFSLKYSTSSSSGKQSFTVSYLISNFGFSQETALNASKRVRFETSQKPDSVVSFFGSHGFSESHINDLIRKNPWLLLCDPHKRILPKFEFFLSKGASSSDIVFMVLRSPRFLNRSLENHIIPSYGVLKGVFHIDKATIDCIKNYPDMLYDSRVIQSINLFLKNGVSGSNIALILGRRPRTLHFPNDVIKAIEEVKGLGFNPLSTSFSVALVAKRSLSESQWEAKVDVYKRWGWSEEAWLKAFRTQPHCMLASNDKIDAVMSFCVNQLGWNSLILANGSKLFGYSLKKRIIPRASVLQFLYSKGLRKKNASLLAPFNISEKQFLERFVKCFEKLDYQLLKLYEENMNI